MSMCIDFAKCLKADPSAVIFELSVHRNRDSVKIELLLPRIMNETGMYNV